MQKSINLEEKPNMTALNVVKKSTGEIVPFSAKKLRHSLERAGADPARINHIVDTIGKNLHPGISTREIYRSAHRMLQKIPAMRYHLKRGIMELGPSGFPFEKYFAEILEHAGYNTSVSQVIPGKCVNHEIDVIAEKDNQVGLVECKFHNRQGTLSDVKTPLYIHSRFLDIMETLSTREHYRNKIHQPWLVTNTRFTYDAIQYGTCAGIKLIAWDYPKNGGLKDLIDASGLYPITCLSSLTRSEKQKLLAKKIVLCTEIPANKIILKQIGLRDTKIAAVIREAEGLSEIRTHPSGKGNVRA